MFLQLYGANSWVRKTGKHPHWKDCNANTIMTFCSVCIKIYCGTVNCKLHVCTCTMICVVSGEANFETTGLTVGRFIQPSIARNILDQAANAEKGLCLRFLWFVPQPTPVPVPCDELTKVNREFSASVGVLITVHYLLTLNILQLTAS